MNAKLYGIIIAVIVTGVIGMMYIMPSAEAQNNIIIPWPSPEPYNNFVKCLAGAEYIHQGALHAIELYTETDQWTIDDLNESQLDSLDLGLSPITRNMLTALKAESIEERILHEEIEQCLWIFRTEILEADHKSKQE